jgi:hypothetical protein
MELFSKEIAVTFTNVRDIADMQSKLVNDEIKVEFATVQSLIWEAQKFQHNTGDDNRPVVLLMLDTSRGADGLVAAPEIKSVKDLDGRHRFVYQKHDVSDFLFRVYLGRISAPCAHVLSNYAA